MNAQLAPDAVRMLSAVLVLGVGVWAGGFMTVPVLSAATRRTLDPAARVELFAAFGRRFAVVMGIAALVVVVAATGLAVAVPHPLTAWTLALALAVPALTAIGIVQARRMSALRRSAATGDGDPGQVRRNAAVALVLRSLIGLLSLALIVLGILLAGRG